ncbi:isoleucyl-tRNA synthetase [Jimgerdemannia flammicorona]|uniref:Isoleucyl-tRNA synthetase n=1 Tax=Jimgerdemannia flammicorona TaxID=994334 RepID=A0A433PR86_9FUNG|nr:isoleucyl-tRNA synthetase [Jimgerdemannia flammicorona]
MSKRLKNYPEPGIIVNKFGADALRLYLINSPVVRAEVLKFKEEGVKDVITRVFLPWYNAYRFFVTQTVLLSKDFDHDFIYNHDLKKLENVMDRWVLASIQSLIQFVREEMAAYRLYTVVPRLLVMIDQLTNWYVRFNRRRLKAPFTPFLTENMYQTLKKFLPESYNLSADIRSIHFLSFPEVRKEYFDADIERAVGRMQSVIELGRVIREKHNISLKTPLKELVVIHSEAQYHEDIRSLERFIFEELNVRDLIVTADEERFGVKYRAEADLKVLGQKLKKDAMKVKNALPSLSSEQVKEFLTKKLLTVEGIIVTDEDIQVVRYFDSDATHYETNTDKGVLILLDTSLYPELEQEGLAREVVNRVQRLRKKVNLQPTDPVVMYYRFTHDLNQTLEQVFKEQKEVMVKVLKRPLLPISEKAGDDRKVLAHEEQEINGSKFDLIFIQDW